MSYAAILIAALILDAVFGEPAWLWSRLPHPAVLMGRMVRFLDQQLNNGSARRLKGAIALICLIAPGLAIGWVCSLAGPVAEILLAAVLLAQRSLVDHVAAVARGLGTSLEAGRVAVSQIVSRDTGEMDETQVVRAAIESAAENLSDGVIAPAFWFLIGGLPAMLVYKFVNTADSMIGYRTPAYEAFGWAAARFDDLMNLLPARATALVIALANGQTDRRGIFADARRHRSPNAGWPEAAISRALGIALSGPRAYEGRMRAFPFVNESGRKTLSAVDIDSSLRVLWQVWKVLVAFCCLLAFLAL